MIYEYRNKVYNLQNVVWVEKGPLLQRSLLSENYGVTLGYNFSEGNGEYHLNDKDDADVVFNNVVFNIKKP